MILYTERAKVDPARPFTKGGNAMFFGFIALMLAVLGILLIGYKYLRDGDMKESRHNNFPAGGFGFILCFFGVMVVFIGMINSLVTHSDQVGYGVELDKIAQFEETYQARADNLTKQFASYLVETYPQYEKEIFHNIAPGNLDIYLVKYPELQASKTIMALVDQERSLRDDIYKQQLARAEVLRNMRYNTLSPWVIQWMMPANVPIPEK